MSLGDAAGRADQATLRALAHPIRLRIMSLLTGASLTAAEVGRELGISHANASYHLRNLLSGGLIVLAGEEKIRGGVGKRYRYDAHREQAHGPRADDEVRADYLAIARELDRRARAAGVGPGPKLLADGDLWVEPEAWAELRDRIADAVRELHDVARPPRTPGTIRTSTSVAMFESKTEDS